MSDHIIKTIEQLREEISKAEETLRPKKLLANQLCEMAGIPAVYTGLDEAVNPVRATIRRNAFYGKPISTCIREYLEMRANLSVREATLDEIFNSLKEGGYDLKSSGSTEDDQKRGVAITLGKNSQTFHRLPTGDFGLTAWYPGVKEKKSKNESNGNGSGNGTTTGATSTEKTGEPKPVVSNEQEA